MAAPRVKGPPPGGPLHSLALAPGPPPAPLIGVPFGCLGGSAPPGFDFGPPPDPLPPGPPLDPLPPFTPVPPFEPLPLGTMPCTMPPGPPQGFVDSFGPPPDPLPPSFGPPPDPLPPGPPLNLIPHALPPGFQPIGGPPVGPEGAAMPDSALPPMDGFLGPLPDMQGMPPNFGLSGAGPVPGMPGEGAAVVEGPQGPPAVMGPVPRPPDSAPPPNPGPPPADAPPESTRPQKASLPAWLPSWAAGAAAAADNGEAGSERKRRKVEGLAAKTDIKHLAGSVTVYSGYSSASTAPATSPAGKAAAPQKRAEPTPPQPSGAAPSGIAGREGLQRQLPEGWEMRKSRSSGKVYYVNEKLGKSQFEPPAGSSIKATGSKKKERVSLRAQDGADAAKTDLNGLAGLVRKNDSSKQKSWQKWQQTSRLLNAPSPERD